MAPCALNETFLSAETREFYRQVLGVLHDAGIPFLVGGAFALGCYTGIARDTKDIDVFVRPRDVEQILQTLAGAGYATELTDTVWIAKAFFNDNFVDVIFSSGNSIATVDDEWFEYAESANFVGISLKLIPVEEMIWSKGYIMTRDRYDGADVAHLLRARAEQLDWPRLLRRFGEHWRLLLSHLVLFGFIYPSERSSIPSPVMHELLGRLNAETLAPPDLDPICRGTLLSTTQYQIDIEQWGYRDARRFR